MNLRHSQQVVDVVERAEARYVLTTIECVEIFGCRSPRRHSCEFARPACGRRARERCRFPLLRTDSPLTTIPVVEAAEVGILRGFVEQRNRHVDCIECRPIGAHNSATYSLTPTTPSACRKRRSLGRMLGVELPDRTEPRSLRAPGERRAPAALVSPDRTGAGRDRRLT